MEDQYNNNVLKGSNPFNGFSQGLNVNENLVSGKIIDSHNTNVQNMINNNNNNDLLSQNVVEGSKHQYTYIGDSPWLSIENRLNNIRSLGVEQSVAKVESESRNVSSIYSNYNSDYIADDSWKVEVDQKLSTANLKLHGKVEETIEVVPRRRAFKSLVEMADSLGSMEPSDQTNMIKLLLSCRKLEKLIEEQQTVLDLLNNDLKEANELLKIPPELRNSVAIGPVPSSKPFYPTSEAPAFIKGRISLLPERYAASKANDKLTPSFANLVAMSQNNVIQEAKYGCVNDRLTEMPLGRC